MSVIFANVEYARGKQIASYGSSYIFAEPGEANHFILLILVGDKIKIGYATNLDAENTRRITKIYELEPKCSFDLFLKSLRMISDRDGWSTHGTFDHLHPNFRNIFTNEPNITQLEEEMFSFSDLREMPRISRYSQDIAFCHIEKIDTTLYQKC